MVSGSSTEMGALVPALCGVEQLKAPMESMMSLDPSLRSVASLREPMTHLATLDSSLRAVAGNRFTQLRQRIPVHDLSFLVGSAGIAVVIDPLSQIGDSLPIRDRDCMRPCQTDVVHFCVDEPQRFCLLLAQ